MQQGKSSIRFETPPLIISMASAAGKKEGQGPLGSYIDIIEQDDMLGKDNWEQAESGLQKLAAEKAIEKGGFRNEDIRYLFAGDLLGQLIATSFGIADLQIPTFGLYGACSTMGEAMMLGAMTVNAGYADRVLSLASSHFATAEKQFRFPLAYGNQRPFAATWTVTGCGAVVIGKGDGAAKQERGAVKQGNGAAKQEGGAAKQRNRAAKQKGNDVQGQPQAEKAEANLSGKAELIWKNPDESNQQKTSQKESDNQAWKQSGNAMAGITGVTAGQIIDMGIKDSMNMGAAMAPAAFYTIRQNFQDFGVDEMYYDKIITGDLGVVGRKILLDMMRLEGHDLTERHMHCGMEIYYQKKQDTHAGGSGCGCSAVTLCAMILPKLQSGEWKRVLFLPTGALLSTVSFNEGQSIPGIAHAVMLESMGR